MASNEHLGFMNEARMIDTLLKQDLKDIPRNQNGGWKGLSWYNLVYAKLCIY